MLSFTNNSGPLFIISTVGVSIFGSSTIGLLLFITHILACITTGIIFRFWKFNSSNITSSRISAASIYSKAKNVNLANLGEIIGNSITSSISTIVMIGGFVVLFSVIISILKASRVLGLLAIGIYPVLNFLQISNDFAIPLITGFLEITNGISLIGAIPYKAISVNIILTAFLLGFGGISVMLQVLSITAKTDLSIKPYILGKLLHGIIASVYTFIFIYAFPFFNFNLM